MGQTQNFHEFLNQILLRFYDEFSIAIQRFDWHIYGLIVLSVQDLIVVLATPFARFSFSSLHLPFIKQCLSPLE
jgi:hypothetical protein